MFTGCVITRRSTAECLVAIEPCASEACVARARRLCRVFVCRVRVARVAVVCVCAPRVTLHVYTAH